MYPTLLLNEVFWLDNTVVTLAEAVGKAYGMRVIKLREDCSAKKFLKIFKKN